MSREARALRAEIAALNVVKQRRRYGADLRRRIASHARERLASGDSLRAIARSLDMSPQVLTRALLTSTALVPVKISAPLPSPAAALIVRGPCGLTIEGASLDEIAGLVERLSSCSG